MDEELRSVDSKITELQGELQKLKYDRERMLIAKQNSCSHVFVTNYAPYTRIVECTICCYVDESRSRY